MAKNIVIRELSSVQGKKVPFHPGLTDQIEAIIEYIGGLEDRVTEHEDKVIALQKKARKIESKYRGLKKLLDGPEPT